MEYRRRFRDSLSIDTEVSVSMGAGSIIPNGKIKAIKVSKESLYYDVEFFSSRLNKKIIWCNVNSELVDEIE